MAGHSGEVPSHQTSDPALPAASTDYFVDVDGETDWDLTNMNAADERCKHTVLMTKFTVLEEAFRCSDVTVPFSMTDVVDLALGCVSAPGAGDVSSKHALRRNSEVYEPQIKYDLPVAQLSSVSSECGTARLLAQERGDDIIRLRALFNTSKDEY